MEPWIEYTERATQKADDQNTAHGIKPWILSQRKCILKSSRHDYQAKVAQLMNDIPWFTAAQNNTRWHSLDSDCTHHEQRQPPRPRTVANTPTIHVLAATAPNVHTEQRHRNHEATVHTADTGGDDNEYDRNNKPNTKQNSKVVLSCPFLPQDVTLFR